MTYFSSYLKLGIVPCLTDLFLLLLLISFFQIYRVHRLTVIILPKSWHIHTPIVTCNRHFCFIFVFDLRISPSNVSRNYNRISNLRSFFFLCQYDTWNHIFNILHWIRSLSFAGNTLSFFVNMWLNLYSLLSSSSLCQINRIRLNRIINISILGYMGCCHLHLFIA